MIDILNKLFLRGYRIFCNLLFDLRYGEFLGGNIKTKHANIGSYDIVNTDYSALPYLFKDSITDTDVLVDVGCGKGRAINWWLSKKLKNKIIGIELDNEIAIKTRRRLRKHKNVEIISGNTLDNIPENGTIFYLYNPFDAEVMKEFKKRLIHRIDHRPRIILIYHNSEHLDIFQDDPMWMIHEIKIPFDEHQSAIIRLLPPKSQNQKPNNY